MPAWFTDADTPRRPGDAEKMCPTRFSESPHLQVSVLLLAVITFGRVRGSRAGQGERSVEQRTKPTTLGASASPRRVRGCEDGSMSPDGASGAVATLVAAARLRWALRAFFFSASLFQLGDVAGIRARSACGRCAYAEARNARVVRRPARSASGDPPAPGNARRISRKRRQERHRDQPVSARPRIPRSRGAGQGASHAHRAIQVSRDTDQKSALVSLLAQFALVLSDKEDGAAAAKTVDEGIAISRAIG